MAWIELHQSVRDHRKIVQLAELLDMPEPHVVGHLSYLWLWAVDNAEDGRLRCSDRAIARAAWWEGDARVFVDACVTAGLLDRDDDGVSVHDWDGYAGKLIAQRKANAERQKRHRESTANRDVTEGKTPATGDPAVTSPSRNGYKRVTSPSRNAATVPNSTVPNPGANAPDARAPTRESVSGFDSFFARYPAGGRGKKAETKAEYDAAVALDGETVVEGGFVRWLTCGRWQRGYVLNAATWLADRKYLEDPPKEPKAKANGINPHSVPKPFDPVEYQRERDRQ